LTESSSSVAPYCHLQLAIAHSNMYFICRKGLC